MAKNEAKIKFTAETGEFNAEIKKANSELTELRSELKLNSTAMKGAGETTKLLQERHSILQKELEVARDKTEALNEKLEVAKRIYGEDSDEVRKLQTQLNNAKNAEQAIENEIQKTNKKLDEQKLSLEKVSKTAENVGNKMTDAGKKMSVVSAGIVAVGTASVTAFNEVDEGADNVIKATGATGESAKGLESVYKEVASSIVGDFGEIGSAVGEINTRFGYTDEKLKESSIKFQQFSEITGVDATEAVKGVSRALNDAGIPLDEYDTLLDQLAKAGQSAGIDVTKLTDSLSENGSIMRAMGFDTEETIALLSQFELSGANTSVMLTGMKKAMANWAESGKDGSKEFANLVEGIQNGSVSASDAIDVFGTKAGPMLVDAIKSGKFEYNDMLKTIQDSKGTVETTFDGTVDGGYKMELAMQNAKVALGAVGETLGSTLAPIVDTVSQKLQSFAGWWSGLNESTQTTIFTIAGVVSAIGPVLIVLGTVASSISKITNVINLMRNSTLLATIATKAQAVAQGALNLIMSANPIALVIIAITALIAIFVTLWNKSEAFRNFWISLWQKVKSIVTTAWSAIKSGVSSAVDAVKTKVTNVFNTVKTTVSNVFNGIKSTATTVWNAVKTAITKPIEQAKDKVKSIVDAIKGFFSNMKLSLPKIKMPHFKVTGKLSLNPPSVPKLTIDWYKHGGIMTKPTIFGVNGTSLMAGGEAGPEAILPIEKLEDYVANAVERTMGVINMQSLANAIEDVANRPIELYIGDRQIAMATASASDGVNGLRSSFKNRGLVLD